MSTDNGKTDHELTKADPDWIPPEIVDVPDHTAELQRPTNHRDAAGGPWVVLPSGFVLPEDPHNHPVKVVQVPFFDFGDLQVTFLVAESIMDDPELRGKFYDEVCKEYADVLPGGSFKNANLKKVNLKDLRSIGIYRVDEMEEELAKMEKTSYLLQDLIPRQSVNIMVGDSGIGKSPFCYELGICIAAGVPFLGIETTQGQVLYLDYEDDVSQMISYTRTISGKLGLSEPPDSFRFWSPAMDENPDADVFRQIHEFRPDFVIIDTISTAFPDAETENHIATALYKRCRDTGAAVLFTHHLKKDSSDENASFDLDLERETTVRDFLNVRGAGALVNTAHLRLKLIRARANDSDWAFVVRGYQRGKGGIPTLRRRCDAGVAEDARQHVHIPAISEKRHCKGVPHRMW
jgi:archaellum biogenesis ATPase FlaH